MRKMCAHSKNSCFIQRAILNSVLFGFCNAPVPISSTAVLTFLLCRTSRLDPGEEDGLLQNALFLSLIEKTWGYLKDLGQWSKKDQQL